MLRVCGQFFALYVTQPASSDMVKWSNIDGGWRGWGTSNIPSSSLVPLAGSDMQHCPSNYWPGLYVSQTCAKLDVFSKKSSLLMFTPLENCVCFVWKDFESIVEHLLLHFKVVFYNMRVLYFSSCSPVIRKGGDCSSISIFVLETSGYLRVVKWDIQHLLTPLYNFVDSHEYLR